MGVLFLLIFIVVPIVEIILLVQIGGMIGWLATILIVILTAFIGTTLLRQQGFGVMARAVDSLGSGKMPMEPVIEGMCLLVAGAFLLTPGLITDTVGFLLLVPVLRMSLAKWLLRRILESGRVNVSVFRGSAEDGSYSESHTEYQSRPGPQDGVIDGEFERVDETTIRPGRSPQGKDGPSGKV
ncbi:MAG: FxsA family protein [Alphaproteobacteria bacterium]|nr:FxsA family protein [Alphaproteobacteria bacterium]